MYLLSIYHEYPTGKGLKKVLQDCTDSAGKSARELSKRGQYDWRKRGQTQEQQHRHKKVSDLDTGLAIGKKQSVGSQAGAKRVGGVASYFPNWRRQGNTHWEILGEGSAKIRKNGTHQVLQTQRESVAEKRKVLANSDGSLRQKKKKVNAGATSFRRRFFLQGHHGGGIWV